MTEPVEFDCIDCGSHVYAFGRVEQTERCATCDWINKIDDPVEREKLRKFLNNRG